MSRIDQMQSSPVSNFIQKDRETAEQLYQWSRRVSLRASRYTPYVPGTPKPVLVVKDVLGPQDYCWTGIHRHWIWERPFKVDFGDGRVETWHWRLFASARGVVLEVEDKYGRPDGESIRKAAPKALAAFLGTWYRIGPRRGKGRDQVGLRNAKKVPDGR